MDTEHLVLITGPVIGFSLVAAILPKDGALLDIWYDQVSGLAAGFVASLIVIWVIRFNNSDVMTNFVEFQATKLRDKQKHGELQRSYSRAQQDTTSFVQPPEFNVSTSNTNTPHTQRKASQAIGHKPTEPPLWTSDDN